MKTALVLLMLFASGCAPIFTRTKYVNGYKYRWTDDGWNLVDKNYNQAKAVNRHKDHRCYDWSKWRSGKPGVKKFLP